MWIFKSAAGGVKKKQCNTRDLLARELITPLFAFTAIGASVAHMPYIAGHFYTHKTDVLMDSDKLLHTAALLLTHKLLMNKLIFCLQFF